MKILGIGLGYLCTASLFVDGKIVAAVSEERFTRCKNEEGYPREAIDYCLKHANLSGDDLDCVVIAGNQVNPTPWITKSYSSFSIEDHMRAQREYWYPRLIEGKDVAWIDVFADKADYDQFPGNWKEIIGDNTDHHGESAWERLKAALYDGICDHIGISPDKIKHVEHHACHAAYAYWGSPLRNEDCLILTADAFGDGLSATVSVLENGSIKRIKAVPHDEFKLGRLYRYMTLVLGMKPAEHEFKVMGLAPYAKLSYTQPAYDAFKETMYVDGLGFGWNVVPKDLYYHFRERLEGIRFDNIAGGLQRYTEDILTKWISNAIEETGIKKVVFSGGVSMNIKANMEICSLEGIEDFYVCPSGGDESLPIGACYHLAAEQNVISGAHEAIEPLQPYLGQSYEKSEIHEWVKQHDLADRYRVVEGVADDFVAAQLAEGVVVGRMVGRMEFGARSLGNRAIIADPRNQKTVEKINQQIKSRDFWMPFAPTILHERLSDYAINPKNIKSPFMTIGFESTELAQEHLPAALHASDKTMRPQVLEHKDNPAYHDLISAFEKRTGVGSLLNTSFNLHGLPIVLGPDEALHVFENSDIDAILLEDVMIFKNSVPEIN